MWCLVWGCFGAGKVGDLYKVKGILNKQGYHCGQRLIGANFLLQQDNDPKTHLHTMQELLREEAVSWYSACNGVASKVTRSQPYWAVVGAAWPYGTQEVPIKPIQLVGGASGSVGWNFFRLPQQMTARMPKVCKAVIAANGELFDERQKKVKIIISNKNYFEPRQCLHYIFYSFFNWFDE